MTQIFIDGSNTEALCPHCKAVVDVTKYRDTKRGYSIWTCKSCKCKIAVWLCMNGEIRINTL